MNDINNVCIEAVDWLKQKVIDAGAQGIVIGLSGGIDSAVVAALSKRAFPDNTLCVIMPCHSNPIDEAHAILVAETLKLKVKKVVLDETFDVFKKSVDSKESDPKLTIANIKSRLRMITLYYHAGLHNYLVAGTGNKSELTIGYFTKYGDGGTDLLPLASFVKKEVKELAIHLGVPEVVITKPPTAGLWENQTDEGEMGMTYEALDYYILTGEGSDEIKSKVKRMNDLSEHKRKPLPQFIPQEKSK
jgi:NAD+ synthase